MTETNNSWLIFKGDADPHNNIKKLPPAPPWRNLKSDKNSKKKNTYILDKEVVELINAAIYLRRPILVTGNPGTGKSSLASAIAHELSLGDVIKWSITTETTLKDGLYRYDAIARLHDVSMKKTDQELLKPSKGKKTIESENLDISNYLRLGPLGSALAATTKPYVLLIDELDKSDFDLPNNLLNIFEDNEFEIPELSRLNQTEFKIKLYQKENKAFSIKNGMVVCKNFPIVIMTSNGERDFPPAFLRRCIQISLPQPDEEKLFKIISKHFGEIPQENQDKIQKLIEQFVNRQEQDLLATDQLMNAVYLILKGIDPFTEKNDLIDTLWHSLK